MFLSYHPPFHFEALLEHYRIYRVGELERFDLDRYTRVVEIDGRVGRVEVRNDPARSRLRVDVDFPDPLKTPHILARVRAMFDLDVDPLAIARRLGVTPTLRRMVARHPGLRVPSGWDAFEISIETILGQLVSVERAVALTHRLIELLGRESGLSGIKLFPRPIDIAESDLVGLGTTGARKHALREFSRRVANGEISLAADQDVDAFIATLRTVRGIGPWTASYVAMKVLRAADAFPATDLILARALEIHPPHQIERMRPWRAYAAVLLWREYAQTLKKTKGVVGGPRGRVR